MTAALDNTQVRRREYMSETRSALANGESLERRSQARQQKADLWTAWLREKMDNAGVSNPVELLPDLAARLEQLAEDKAAEAVRKLEAKLKKALAP
jgi:hypothetical protein